jgi:hypothetical protein
VEFNFHIWKNIYRICIHHEDDDIAATGVAAPFGSILRLPAQIPALHSDSASLHHSDIQANGGCSFCRPSIRENLKQCCFSAININSRSGRRSNLFSSPTRTTSSFLEKSAFSKVRNTFPISNDSMQHRYRGAINFEGWSTATQSRLWKPQP